jgi:hypothetical protein
MHHDKCRPPESVCSKTAPTPLWSHREFPQAGVSGAAELHQVKIPARKNSQIVADAAEHARKRKSPALPGFFDEYLFQSVYFASFAI